MEDLIRQILSLIPHIDMDDPNLHDTPARIAKMYQEMFWGLDPANEPRITTFPVDGNGQDLVGTGKIFFSSTCAHHFLPFTGHAHIFYLPDKRVVGLSKFTRIVSYYAARPQIQERLAAQIADHVMAVSSCRGCFVVMRATHSCMQCRGVRQEESVMISSVIRPVSKEGMPVGPFSKASTRNEVLAIMEMDK